MSARVTGLLGFTLAVVVAGCGSSTSQEPRQTTQDGGAATVAITIQAPADGARLKARVIPGERLRARTRIRGRARPGSVVFLSAACRPEPCEAQPRAGVDGTWAASLTLRVPQSASFVTIDANAQRGVVAAGSAVATVELVGPGSGRATGAASSAGERRRTASASPRAPSRAPSRRALPRDVLVIGDSLAVGMEPSLKAALSGWRVRLDGRIGRPLAEGMSILARQSSTPAILAFSLFTNDGPRNTGALEAAVRSSAMRPGGCAVWATVVRPPLDGVSYDTANAMLRQLANDPELALGLQLVDWAAEVGQSPSMLAGDGVHATAAGYRVLGQLYAQAITACAGAG